MEQHIIATEKLRFQLFTLQNSLIDGTQMRKSSFLALSVIIFSLDLDSWLQSCCSNKSQILPEEVVSNIVLITVC